MISTTVIGSAFQDDQLHFEIGESWFPSSDKGIDLKGRRPGLRLDKWKYG